MSVYVHVFCTQECCVCVYLDYNFSLLKVGARADGDAHAVLFNSGDLLLERLQVRDLMR